MTEPAAVCRVRMFGPSSLTFSDSGPDGTLLGLTAAALRERQPDVTWQCAVTVLYLSPNMAARVRDVTERERPDVVFLRPPDMQILQDYVVYGVRERWPGLYRTSVRLSAWLIDLAGGGPQGAPWFRGWLFRAPRWLMSKVVGVAPAMRVPDAVACVRETLDALSRLEELTVVYSLPMSTVPPNISIAEARRRRDEFASGVKAYCADKRIPCLDADEARARSGPAPGLASDRWHPDLANLRFDAGIIADTLLRAIDGATGLEVESDVESVRAGRAGPQQ